MAEYYYAVNSAGTGAATDFTNRGNQAALQTKLESGTLAGGDIIHVLYVPGEVFTLSDITIDDGGASDTSRVWIRGEQLGGDSYGKKPIFDGGRTNPWVNNGVDYGENIFLLTSAADYITIENIEFRNCNRSIYVTDANNTGLKVLRCNTYNSRTLVDLGAVSVNQFEIGFCNTYKNSVGLLWSQQTGGTGGFIHDFYVDATTDSEDAACGIKFNAAGSEFTIMNGFINATGGYIDSDGSTFFIESEGAARGDGISTEDSVSNVYIFNVRVENAPDTGFDLKSSETYVENCYAYNCKHGFKVWDANTWNYAVNCTVDRSYTPNTGNGGNAFEVNNNGTWYIIGLKVRNNSRAQSVFTFNNGGSGGEVYIINADVDGGGTTTVEVDSGFTYHYRNVKINGVITQYQDTTA